MYRRRETCNMKELEMSTAPVPVDLTLFKAYDVRGIAGENLTDKVAYRIGRAAPHYLNVPEIAVGRDMRLSSPQLAASLLRGIIVQVTTDGLTFDYGDWWFNVRPSNTEPLLRVNVQARTKTLMEQKRDEILALIRG